MITSPYDPDPVVLAEQLSEMFGLKLTADMISDGGYEIEGDGETAVVKITLIKVLPAEQVLAAINKALKR